MNGNALVTNSAILINATNETVRILNLPPIYHKNHGSIFINKSEVPEASLTLEPYYADPEIRTSPDIESEKIEPSPGFSYYYKEARGDFPDFEIGLKDAYYIVTDAMWRAANSLGYDTSHYLVPDTPIFSNFNNFEGYAGFVSWASSKKEDSAE